MWRKWTWMFAPLLIVSGPALAAQQEQPAAAGAATSAEDCRPADIKLQFGFDSDSLDDMSRRSLDSAAAWLQESPNRRLRLEGYADPSGATTYNDDLSYRRADAGKRHLVAQGIDPSRVNAVGQGEMSPAGLAGGSQQRAVMVLYCEGPAAAPTTGEATPPRADRAASRSRGGTCAGARDAGAGGAHGGDPSGSPSAHEPDHRDRGG